MIFKYKAIDIGKTNWAYRYWVLGCWLRDFGLIGYQILGCWLKYFGVKGYYFWDGDVKMGFGSVSTHTHIHTLYYNLFFYFEIFCFFYNIFLDKLFNVVIKLNKFTHQNTKVSLI